LAHLASLVSVGSLSIGGNDGLVRFGLESLESVEFSLRIAENGALVDLEGLEALTRVGSLLIQNNPALESANGLSSLITVADTIEIGQNNALVSLAALGNVRQASRLSVYYNSSLPTCEAQWLADSIGIDNVGISGNDDEGVCAR
jgi:hypothetical protein